MRSKAAVIFALVGVTGLLANVASAGASTPEANWSIEGFAAPTNFSTADNAADAGLECSPVSILSAVECDLYEITATDSGAKPAKASSVTIEDTLPPGLAVGQIPTPHVSLYWSGAQGGEVDLNASNEDCTVVLPHVKCTIKGAFFEEVDRVVHPDDRIMMVVGVTVDEPVTPGLLTSEARVEGGGAPAQETSFQNTLEEGAPPSGFALFSAPTLSLAGTAEVQAGAHPYELPTRIDLNSDIRETANSRFNTTSVQDPRDILVDLPLGLVGSALSTPKLCTLAQLHIQSHPGCPAESVIGYLRTLPKVETEVDGPLYNMVPEHGVAAEFGFVDVLSGAHVLYASLAPTPAGYVLRTSSTEVPQAALTKIEADIYGDPPARDGSSAQQVPTFTSPSDCSGEPLETIVHMDSWSHPGSKDADGSPNLNDPNWISNTYESPPVTDCEALAGLFNPTLTTHVSSTAADSPTGLDVNVKVPQSEGTETLAVPPAKDTVVTLPEGMTVNPSSANGLEACSEAQIGWQGATPAAGESELEDFSAAPPACPNASKIGTVEIETPALPSEGCKEIGKQLSECPEPSEREKTPLTGSIYVAKQTENPFASLLAIYIVVDDARTGVVVKIPAKVEADPNTGRLTTVVDDTPQFPFSELRTHFYEGNTAALKTSATCGTYTVASTITPWSAPQSGPPSTPSGSFEINQGPGGGTCAHSPAEEPNSPSFEAGTQAPVAGAFSPLVVHLTRGDGSQNFSALNVTLPPGATGKLAGIPQCSDAQIAQAQARSNPGEGAAELASPSCPAASEVGMVTVGAGAGPSPFYVTGHAYLAGPYKGAPFSMAIITSAIAGPFDLGVVVVRAGLYINPNTAQVTAKSDAIPTILQGIPLDVRSITVDVNRPGFTLNPTSCNPMTVTGEETSTIGKTASLSDRFQVGSCQNLKFAPKFTISTAGRTSKAQGASLGVKVAYPTGSLGSQANIARVDLQLPKQLPARLTTLQKACTEGQFDTNPADCPAASMIGTAKAITPLLASPLVGPAILVSHGGAAFPDVEFLLQGEGVEVVLDGKTQIKKGITYSHFETVPDAPIGTFETTFPQGPYSVLSTDLPVSAKNSLCGQALTLPTTLTAQDGAIITQTTKATITGCTKTKALTRAQKLTKALQVCHKDKRKTKRAACEKQARKKYGPAVKKKTKKR